MALGVPAAVPFGGGLGAMVPQQRASEITRETRRKKVAPRDLFTEEASMARAVFIYSLGPFAVSQQIASWGSYYLPGVPLESALKVNDVQPEHISVAGPLMIPGNPAEPWIDDQEGKWIPHARYAEKPGLDLALTIIGAGMRSGPRDDIRPMGFFVSEVPAVASAYVRPKTPGAGVSEIDRSIYRDAVERYEAAVDHSNQFYAQHPEAIETWNNTVSEARRIFTEWCSRQCEDGNAAVSNNTWDKARDVSLGHPDPAKGLKLYFTCARILKKTPVECSFLSNTVEATSRKHCIECGSTMMADKPRCPACKALQMSDEEYKEWKRDRNAASKATQSN